MIDPLLTALVGDAYVVVFMQMKTIVEISFFEIYNEKIHDLLASSTAKDKGSVKKTNVCIKDWMYY